MNAQRKLAPRAGRSGTITDFVTATLLMFAHGLGSSAWAGSGTGAPSNANGSVGMNLIWVTDWESMMPFIDTFKKARPWTANSGTLDLDERGWVRSLLPGQTATAAVMTPNPSGQQTLANKFPSGQYALTYVGTGAISLVGNAVTEVLAPHPGRVLVSLDFSQPDAGFSIRIDTTDPNDYVRDIRLYMPGGVCNHDPFHHASSPDDCAPGAYEENEYVADEFLFYAPFLDNLKHYRVIRYLQRLGVNGSSVTTASEWRRLDAATWWGQLPIEVVAQLANRLNADVWLNIPQRADDDLVLHWATIMQANLNPALTVYTELSNEVWNSAFPYATHAQWFAAQGCARYMDLTGCDLDATPGNGVLCEGYPWPNQVADCTTARNRYFSDRTVEVGAIFASMVGSERLVRVMGGWNQPNYNRSLLEHNDNFNGVDAIAFPTYFGGYIPSNLNNAEILQQWLDEGGQALALERVFQELLEGNVLRPYYLPGGAFYDPARPGWQLPPVNGSIPAMLEQTAGNVALAREFGLSPVSYEGGHHLDVTVNANSTSIRELMLAAGRDPRMATAFTRYLEGWREIGGEMLVLYVSHSSSSGFGLLDYELQAHGEQPRFAAVEQFIANNPCWWAGCPIELFTDGFE